MSSRPATVEHRVENSVVARTPAVIAEGCSCQVALEGRWGQAYNEEAFRYFLAIERKRAERAGHPLLLLLASLKEHSGASGRIDTRLARLLFSSLWLSLRDTDIIGWYREGLVAGAVLTESRPRPRTNVSRVVRQRVSDMLGQRLPADVVRRIRVRVYENPQLEEIHSGGIHLRGGADLGGI